MAKVDRTIKHEEIIHQRKVGMRRNNPNVSKRVVGQQTMVVHETWPLERKQKTRDVT